MHLLEVVLSGAAGAVVKPLIEALVRRVIIRKSHRSLNDQTGSFDSQKIPAKVLRMAAHAASTAYVPREPKDVTQVTVRIDTAWLPELDAVARALSRPGLEVSRTEALRAAVAAGIKALKEEFSLPAGLPEAPRSKPTLKKKR